MARLLWICILALIAGPVMAQEAPSRGPAPAWADVLDVPIPETGSAGQAGVHLHLIDQQVYFDDAGSHAYIRTAYTVTSSQGMALATFGLVWNPAFQTVTVHEAEIWRGDQKIDVLQDQDFEIIRREENLRRSMLTGVLTGVLQPRGLRVGDTLVFSYSMTTLDPTFDGHHEIMATFAFPLSVDRLRIRASWPDSVDIRVRGNGRVDTPSIRREGALSVVEVDQRDFEPLQVPSNVPQRYQHIRQLEFTDYAEWAQISTLMAPLYDRTAVLEPGSALMEQVESIRASGGTPAQMTMAALRLVQDEIRYVALAMGEGGLVPVSAEETWRNRYGDCKAKSALLIAILRELGIEAQPALVSFTFGDGLDQRLPLIALFDHVIVRAVIDGEVYWLDGTRTGDRSLAEASNLSFKWALPVSEAGHALEAMPQPALQYPLQDVTVRIDASAGLYAPVAVEGEAILRGAEAAEMNALLTAVPESDRNLFARTLIPTVGQMDDPEISIAYDQDTGELRMTLAGQATLSWRDGAGGRKEWSMPLTQPVLDLYTERQPGPFEAVPLNIVHPYSSRLRYAVVLPETGAGYEVSGEAFDVVLFGHQINRTVEIEGGIVTADVLHRSLVAEIPLEQGRADQDTLRSMRSDQIRIRAPDGYRPTEADLVALEGSSDQTAKDHIDRGLVLWRSGESTLAVEAFDRAIVLEPDNANAHANRGLVRVYLGQFEEAEADIERALDLDPSETVAMNGRGMLAMRAGDYEEAVIAFSRSIRYSEDNIWALGQRANAYVVLGEYDKALADADRVLEAVPGSQQVILTKSAILVLAHRADEALALIEAALADSPDDPAYLATMADLQLEYGDPGLALAAADSALSIVGDDPAMLTIRSIAHYRMGDDALGAASLSEARVAAAGQPDALNNICWGLALENLDLEGALADCDAALAAAPGAANIMDSRAMVLLRLGRFDEALAQYDEALLVAPDLAPSLYGRGVAKWALGRQAEGQADMDNAVSLDRHVSESFADVESVDMPARDGAPRP
ncbi:MAG: tetratricopeptide repeat protein [Alphaproteobacteria bacterium]|nr:tetratricopeptide repeat protein [Alphaproteobacteria bacterium]